MCAGVFEVLPDRPISRSTLRDANGRIDDHLTLTPVSVRGHDDRIVVVRILDRRRHIAFFVGFHPDAIGWELVDIWNALEYSRDVVRVTLVQWADRRYPEVVIRHAVPPLTDEA